eukprot:16802_5
MQTLESEISWPRPHNPCTTDHDGQDASTWISQWMLPLLLPPVNGCLLSSSCTKHSNPCTVRAEIHAWTSLVLSQKCLREREFNCFRYLPQGCTRRHSPQPALLSSTSASPLPTKRQEYSPALPSAIEFLRFHTPSYIEPCMLGIESQRPAAPSGEEWCLV